MSWKDSLKKAGTTFLTGGVNVLLEAKAQRKLGETGTPTSARCTSFSPGWEHSDSEGDPVWGSSRMTLLITPPEGGEPYEWTGEIWVRVKTFRESDAVLEGSELPVRLDPDDRNKVAVDWNAFAEAHSA